MLEYSKLARKAGQEISVVLGFRRAHPTKHQQEKGEFRMLRANGLVALVLLGFGIAHVVGAVLLLRAANPEVRQAAIVTNQGD
jgi:hypothetical protein